MLLRSLLILLACLSLAFAATPAQAAQVQLAWEAPVQANGTPVPNLAGYKLYYGSQSGQYPTMVPVGLTTTYTVTNVSAGQTYYFTVKAYNTTGTESAFSNEVRVTLPTNTPGGGIIPQQQMRVVSVDSQELVGENGAATNAIDGNTATFWHTKWFQQTAPLPHTLVLDLGGQYQVDGFRYLPRQDGASNGTIAGYQFYVSADGTTWGTTVAAGTLAANTSEKIVRFTAKTGRYVRLVALSEINRKPWTSAAALNIFGSITQPTGSAPTAGSSATPSSGPVTSPATAPSPLKPTAGSSATPSSGPVTSPATAPTSPKPIAAFSATPTSGRLPLKVAFTDASNGSITTWAWDFGDGSTSALRQPTHSYATKGTYTVTLTVTGPGGSSAATLTVRRSEALAPSLPSLWDTSWYLASEDPTSISAYLQARADQEFDVVMFGAVHWSGPTTRLGAGGAPFYCGNVSCPNEAAFDHIEWMIDEANRQGLTPAVLPIGNIGTPEHVAMLVNDSRAYTYGRYLASRFAGKNLIWVLGGDSCPTQDLSLRDLVRGLAGGIRAGGAGQKMTVHTNSLKSGWCSGTSDWFGNDDWLTFNMIQTRGPLDRAAPVADAVRADYYGYGKPTGIGEANYEGAQPADVVRADAYRTYLAGGAYYTYGSIHSCCDGPQADETLGVAYVRIAREFVSARGWLDYAPDESFVVSHSGEKVAMIRDSTAAMVYLANGGSTSEIDMSRLCGGGGTVHVERFNPANSSSSVLGDYSCNGGKRVFNTGGLADAVILLDAGASSRPKP